MTHVYPLRDSVNTEDLGKKAGAFSLRGFVLGDDFIAQAASLKAACEAPGAGALVHPLWGSINVVCLECRPTYSTRRKGMVEFALSFKEEGENKNPSADDDYQVIAAAKAQASLALFQTNFAEAATFSGPDWLKNNMAKDLVSALGLIQTATIGLGDPSGVMASALAAAGDKVEAALAEASALDAGTVTDVVDTAMSGIASAAHENPEGALNASLKLGGPGAGQLFEPGPGHQPGPAYPGEQPGIPGQSSGRIRRRRCGGCGHGHGIFQPAAC